MKKIPTLIKPYISIEIFPVIIPVQLIPPKENKKINKNMKKEMFFPKNLYE